MIDKGIEVTKDKETRKRIKIRNTGIVKKRVERGVAAKIETEKSKLNRLKNRRFTRKAKAEAPALRLRKIFQKKKDLEN